MNKLSFLNIIRILHIVLICLRNNMKFEFSFQNYFRVFYYDKSPDITTLFEYAVPFNETNYCGTSKKCKTLKELKGYLRVFLKHHGKL